MLYPAELQAHAGILATYGAGVKRTRGRYARSYARQPPGGLLKVRRAHDVVTIEHCSGLVAGHPHRHALGHSMLTMFRTAVLRRSWRRRPATPAFLRAVPQALLKSLIRSPRRLLHLIHTPEVPQELRAGAIASANRRYATYRQAVSERLAKQPLDGDEGGTGQGKQQQ